MEKLNKHNISQKNELQSIIDNIMKELANTIGLIKQKANSADLLKKEDGTIINRNNDLNRFHCGCPGQAFGG